MFKKGLLILTLCLTTIGLSGCGKSFKNGVEFVNGLDVKLQEVTPSQEYLDWLKENSNKNSNASQDNKEDSGVVVSITNNTKYYFNNMPVGVIVDSEQLTLDNLKENEYSVATRKLILAPGDTFTTVVEDVKADSKITLVPDYKEGGDKDDLTTDSDIKDLDSKFFDKYVTKESSDKMLYPSDVNVGKPSYKNGVMFSSLSVEISNNSDKEVGVTDTSKQDVFFPIIVQDKQIMGATLFTRTDNDDNTAGFKLPAKGTATAKFLYIGPAENVENFTLQFNGLALE